MDLLSALAADALVWLHLGFILFVVLGAALLWRWPWLVLLHVPAVLWGIWVELSGSICPLTPLENRLRMRAGQGTYEGGFVEHYLLPLIYPAGLTQGTQVLLGLGVLLVNAVLYGWWLARCARAPRLLQGILPCRRERNPCRKRMSSSSEEGSPD